jgi:hypothetical protein
VRAHGSATSMAEGSKETLATSWRMFSRNPAPPRTLITNLEDGVAKSSGPGDGGGKRPRLPATHYPRLLQRHEGIPPHSRSECAAAIQSFLCEPSSSWTQVVSTGGDFFF